MSSWLTGLCYRTPNTNRTAIETTWHCYFEISISNCLLWSAPVHCGATWTIPSVSTGIRDYTARKVTLSRSPAPTVRMRRWQKGLIHHRTILKYQNRRRLSSMMKTRWRPTWISPVSIKLFRKQRKTRSSLWMPGINMQNKQCK